MHVAAAGLVQNRKASDEDDIDQALIDVWNQGGRTNCVRKKQVLGHSDEPVDAAALSAATRHTRLSSATLLASPTPPAWPICAWRERTRAPSADRVIGRRR